MSTELLDELAERLEGLGVEREEAEEILRELHESSYADGYDQGVADTRQEGGDPEDEEDETPELWDNEKAWNAAKD